MSFERGPRRKLNTVRDVIDEYVRRCTEHSRHTRVWGDALVNYQDFVAKYGDMPIEDLIPDDLESWVESHQSWKSDWTRKRVAQTIKRAFSWAWKRGLIDRHPLVGVCYPAGERGEPMNDEHYQALLRGSDPTFRRVLVFLRWTGCRPCEMSALEWTHIDAERGVAVLQKHKTKRTRKDRAPRVIILPAPILKLLRWIAANQRESSPYIFLNNRSGRWTRNALTLRIHYLRRRLAIPAGVKLYGLRHKFATTLAKNGTELKTLSLLLGHTTTRMSEHYVHLEKDTDHLRAALMKAMASKARKDGDK